MAGVGAGEAPDATKLGGAAEAGGGAGEERTGKSEPSEGREATPHGSESRTESLARTRALVESAALIARPTPLAPGIRDFASTLSR